MSTLSVIRRTRRPSDRPARVYQAGRRLDGPWEVNPSGPPVTVFGRTRLDDGTVCRWRAQVDAAEVAELAVG